MAGPDEELLRWHRLESLWEEARSLGGTHRSDFLDREAADDPGLRAELEALLARADEAEQLINRLYASVGRGADDLVAGLLLRDVKDGLDGRYIIDREIGRGGSATVFHGRDLRSDTEIAVKVLHAEVTAAIGRNRFEREMQLAASIRHPCILPLLDRGLSLGTAGRTDRPWYVMPYVAGGSLRMRLAAQDRLPASDSLRIATNIGDALDYAHGRGLIHRDVKPENILLGEGGALLADFGVARMFDSEESGRLTTTGFVPGTPPYMSPEQAVGTVALDGRSDLYSLACVVHEMMTGAPPERTRGGGSGRAAKIADGWGPRSRRVFERALAAQPKDRYPVARTFITELNRAVESEPIPGPGPA